MPALDMNMNMNMNMGFGTPTGAARFRARYNTDIYTKLIDPTVMLVPLPTIPGTALTYPRFHEHWDADLRSYKYLQDFIEKVPNWRTQFITTATASNIQPQNMNQNQLNAQVVQILDLALEREDRYLEVIDQDDADGAINYWLGLLKIDPARHPGTYLMVQVGRRIGEHVSMCLKEHFHSPRPSQLCPAIAPMIDPPATPSFPAGHAVQSYLISYLLAYSLPKLPQHLTPAAPALASATGLLFDLAARVSENRIVAGIHYPTDIAAGKAVAIDCFAALSTITSGIALIPSIWGTAAGDLRHEVQQEFPQYV